MLARGAENTAGQLLARGLSDASEYLREAHKKENKMSPKNLRIIAVSTIIMIFIANNARSQDISIVNRTGYQINELYISSSRDARWGVDALGRNVLPPGRYFQFRFSSGNNDCFWDVKIVYNNMNESEIRNLDFCGINAINLFWDQLRRQTTFATERAATSQQAPPPISTGRQSMSSANRDLRGTAWKMEFPNNTSRRGITGSIFLFCNSGRWEMVPERGGVGPSGTYLLSGENLTTISSDGTRETYRITWSGDILDLGGRDTRIRLHPNGAARC